MKKERIDFMDWHRILIGEAPALFIAEVLLRCLILYPVLLVTVRLMGKRINGQLSVFEMVVMITLGAIVAPGMQLPDRGVLFSVTVLLGALMFHRGISLMSFHHPWFQRLTQGTSTLMVKNGVLQLKAMRKAGISKQQLCSILREKGVLALGSLERVYLESAGLYSIFPARSPAPGMLTLPAHERMPERGGRLSSQAYTDTRTHGKK